MTLVEDGDKVAGGVAGERCTTTVEAPPDGAGGGDAMGICGGGGGEEVPDVLVPTPAAKMEPSLAMATAVTSFLGI